MINQTIQNPSEIVDVRRESEHFYRVLNKITGVEGFVLVSEAQLGDFKEGSLLYDALIMEADDSERVLDIDIFAPHGEDEPDPAFTKRGIGGYVLKRVLEDMTEKGITIAYCHEPSPSCRSLLSKNGFRELNDGKTKRSV